jgi:transglutaminase-like putative cysteine protease
LELHVHPVQPAFQRKEGEARSARPGAEFLASCRYIDADHERIRNLAQRAVGDEKDPWRKALRIERWVKTNLRVDNAQDIVPASQVAANLRGDCRSAALLTAALCRAEGIPARTALGLIYVLKGRPQFGFHMWTEVWIEGQWLGLDGTLGRGGVSATHLKVSDHGWFNVESLTPLLPINRVLGKMTIDVISVEGGE